MERGIASLVYYQLGGVDADNEGDVEESYENNQIDRCRRCRGGWWGRFQFIYLGDSESCPIQNVSRGDGFAWSDGDGHKIGSNNPPFVEPDSASRRSE